MLSPLSRGRAEAALWRLVVLVLLAGLLHVAESHRTVPPMHPECPQYLRDYVQWHKENKFNPQSKYMMYDCMDGSCAGLADRLRGMMWMVRMAIFSSRVLLVRMNVPVPIHHMFKHTHIDWTVPSWGMYNGQNVTLEPPSPLPGFGNIMDVPADREAFLGRTETWIGGRTNIPEDFHFPPTPKVASWTREASCLLQALIMPTEKVEHVVTRHYAQMQINPLQPYLAIHLRIFNMIGEGQEMKHSLDTEDRMLSTIMCSREMAPRCNVDLAVNPAVLITDGLHIRRRASLRLYDHLTSAAIVPHHFDEIGNNGLLDRHLETVADFIILSRASALFVDMQSGFSRLSSSLGGLLNVGSNPCLQDNNVCKRHLEQLEYRMERNATARKLLQLRG